MKKHLILSVLSCLLLIHNSYAQNSEEKTGYKYNNHFDIALSVGKSEFATSLSWSKLHDIAIKGKFKIGYGIRLTNYFGSGKAYTTAPASLIKEQKIDEVIISSAQTNSLNATINFQYSLSRRFEAGFNIDALGLSFGGEKNAAKSALVVAKARPTRANFLLVGNNDIGSLNSEFYLRFWMAEKMAIRVGFNHLFSEYTTDTKLAHNNNRYRLITNLGFVALTFSPYK